MTRDATFKFRNFRNSEAFSLKAYFLRSEGHAVCTGSLQTYIHRGDRKTPLNS